MAIRGTQDLTKQQGEQPSAVQRQSRGGASPFGLVSRMMDDMDRWFGGGALGVGFVPQIEMKEHDGKLCIRADLPGLEPKDVEVNVEDDILTLRGERRSEQEDERDGVYHRELSYGRFERSIVLPTGINPDAIDAKFENGVLEISAPMPKAEERRGKRIEVQASTEAKQKAEAKKTSH